jgi:hypothetical protein
MQAIFARRPGVEGEEVGKNLLTKERRWDKKLSDYQSSRANCSPQLMLCRSSFFTRVGGEGPIISVLLGIGKEVVQTKKKERLEV